MVKTVKIFIFFLILVTIFNQQIVSNISLHFLSKWVERKVSVDDFKISYKDGIITMKNVKIQNPSKFYYKNFVHLNKIVLDYNLKTVFSKLIVINNLTFEKPKFYLEVIEGPSVELSPFNVQKMYDDNVGGVKKIVKSEPEKIWPKKKRDTNFIILDVKINGAQAFIKTSYSNKPTKIEMKDIHFTKIGNGGKDGDYIHHKDALKLIYYNLISTIPDQKLKVFLKKIYNYKSLLGAYSESLQ